MLDVRALKIQIITLINLDGIGDTRIFNHVKNKIGSDEETISFMVKHLGYEKWYINKLVYNQKYKKQRYQQKVNSPNNI